LLSDVLSFSIVIHQTIISLHRMARPIAAVLHGLFFLMLGTLLCFLPHKFLQVVSPIAKFVSISLPLTMDAYGFTVAGIAFMGLGVMILHSCSTSASAETGIMLSTLLMMLLFAFVVHDRGQPLFHLWVLLMFPSFLWTACRSKELRDAAKQRTE
jgi:hypothetical protein